jgi:hypothetical protein
MRDDKKYDTGDDLSYEEHLRLGHRENLQARWDFHLDGDYDGHTIHPDYQRDCQTDVIDVYTKHMQYALDHGQTERLLDLMFREWKIQREYIKRGFPIFRQLNQNLEYALYNIFRGWRRMQMRRALTTPDADVAAIIEQLEEDPIARRGPDFQADLNAAERKVADPSIDMMADIRPHRAR